MITDSTKIFLIDVILLLVVARFLRKTILIGEQLGLTNNQKAPHRGFFIKLFPELPVARLLCIVLRI